MAPTNWPAWVKTFNVDEMLHIRRLAVDIVDHELEAELHPFLQTVLEWASLRTSIPGPNGYRLRTIAQFIMTIPPDAFDAPEPTERQTRATSQAHGVVHGSLSSISASTMTASSGPSVISNPQQRAKDRRRTPDYATLLSPHDPAKPHPRLLFVHELKRYEERVFQEVQEGSKKSPYEVILESSFRDMEEQIAEQAELALWTFRDLRVVYVMCHVGVHFKVVRFGRKNSKSAGRRARGGVTALYKSKVYMLLNEDCTDFSGDFKIWWTIVKHGQVGDLGARTSSTPGNAN
ncbi:uncharacterized protein C8Q71DRAFT_854948 [Rhodofomes roseus]|uniref:Uncharacterized protein n=1 Tax=Rhodofomes roseus TaxID=34475 RepID=A0ABQ8KRD3_9APHY|nr:uncharacterized protein C8Q71DRAFT_854948 [Rhodofomes roseus]KAH9841095.1 hypothetical protein C8Q71DRAFT_854948 [Rhodofomes roseus]